MHAWGDAKVSLAHTPLLTTGPAPPPLAGGLDPPLLLAGGY
jgi:hypothetical protein